MSVKSKPGTGSHTLESKISETTSWQDKGQNRDVIEWLARIDGSRPFLKTASQTWTYRDAVAEVARRAGSGIRVVEPSGSPQSVFDCLAATGDDAAVIVGPGTELGSLDDVQGADLVLYTSGTSGVPKGVRFSMSNLEAASQASIAHLGHGSDDTWLLSMGLHHVAGLSIVIRSALAGGSIRMLDGFDPAIAARAMRGDVTMVSVVPTMLRQVLDQDAGPFVGLRGVLVGGGPIPPGLLERADAAGMPVLPTYGMTETFGQVATLRPGAPLAYHAHPLPGVELRVNRDGVIEVAGSMVSPGYVGEPDRDSRWFTTADVGVLEPDGAVKVVGRTDTIIVTGGENVDPVRVEAEIRSHGIEEVIVVGVPDEQWGAVLVAVFSGSGSSESVDEALRGSLPRHMVPTRWVRVDEVPRTALGKPDRPAALLLAG